MSEWGQCHFCGTYVKGGYDNEGERHWLSDCRPDLVEHAPGETCTWWNLGGFTGVAPEHRDCYAYQENWTNAWTDDHIHFYPDGPMG